MFGADDLLDHPDTNNHRQKTVPLIMAGESMAAEYRGWSVGAAMLGKISQQWIGSLLLTLNTELT